jgi:hypothetical protein
MSSLGALCSLLWSRLILFYEIQVLCRNANFDVIYNKNPVDQN